MHISLQAVIWAGVALAVPYFLWAVLAIGARNRPWVLPFIYPALRIFCWLTAVVPLCLGLLLLFDQSGLKRAFWLAIVFNSGIQLVRYWVLGRIAPESLVRKPYEGWWPAKKDF
jgi:hypothetical protein